MKTKKQTYKTPIVQRTKVDTELSLIMMSTPPTGPEETIENLLWQESGWVSKVFKLWVR